MIYQHVFFLLLKICLFIKVNSQEDNYIIGPNGLGKIHLLSNAKTIQDLRALNKAEKNEFIFRPDEASYKSLDTLFINNPNNPFKACQVFIACDSMGIVKKIVLFVEGSSDEIVQFLDAKFQVAHLKWKSFKDNIPGQVSNIWHTKNETTISLADLSDFYNSKLMMIEFVHNSNPESILMYSIIKEPKFSY